MSDNADGTEAKPRKFTREVAKRLRDRLEQQAAEPPPRTVADVEAEMRAAVAEYEADVVERDAGRLTADAFACRWGGDRGPWVDTFLDGVRRAARKQWPRVQWRVRQCYAGSRDDLGQEAACLVLLWVRHRRIAEADACRNRDVVAEAAVCVVNGPPRRAELELLPLTAKLAEDVAKSQVVGVGVGESTAVPFGDSWRPAAPSRWDADRQAAIDGFLDRLRGRVRPVHLREAFWDHYGCGLPLADVGEELNRRRRGERRSTYAAAGLEAALRRVLEELADYFGDEFVARVRDLPRVGDPAVGDPPESGHAFHGPREPPSGQKSCPRQRAQPADEDGCRRR